jgi:curved DNA-binding protein CbpA
MTARDPYQVLGVRANASDEEIRAAYRRLVQLHHPDHNNGSPESARRFEEVQEAYLRIRQLRETGAASRGRTGPPREPDPALDARLADLERQVRKAQERARREAGRVVREAQRVREAAQRAARDATRSDRPGRPTDEELGYITTEDSFGKILSDARDELASRFSDAREHPAVKRVSDLIEGLEDLASKLDDDLRKGQR